MMFVDASAIVAMVTEEPDGEAIAALLEAAPAAVTSAIAIYEATVAVLRKRAGTVSDAQAQVEHYLAAAGVRTVPITGREANAALQAFARYGKGRGHPAQLNMGDCFAYAAAKTHEAVLLFKGDNFSRTDVIPA